MTNPRPSDWWRQLSTSACPWVDPTGPCTVTVKVSVLPLREPATVTVGVYLPIVTVSFWVALPTELVATTHTV